MFVDVLPTIELHTFQRKKILSTELRSRYGQGRVHVRALCDRSRGCVLYRATEAKRTREVSGADVCGQYSKYTAGMRDSPGDKPRDGVARNERREEEGRGRVIARRWTACYRKLRSKECEIEAKDVAF